MYSWKFAHTIKSLEKKHGLNLEKIPNCLEGPKVSGLTEKVVGYFGNFSDTLDF